MLPTHTAEARVINVDKNTAYPPAVAASKEEGWLPEETTLRQSKYLNNVIEQDYRFIKRLTRPMLGFQSFRTAWRALRGIEIMNLIRKGQIQDVAKGDLVSQNAFVAQLFGIAA